MNNFNDDKLDKMLKAYCTREEDFTFNKPKKIKHTALIAACLVLVILAGVMFIPSLSPKKEHSFTIVANAQTLDEEGLATKDEINHDAYVTFATVDSSNIVFFDFDEPLLADVPEYNIVKNYLFHNFFTNFYISVEGEDIETITYKASDGGFNLTICSGEIPEDDDLNPRHFVYTGYERAQREKTIKYSEQPYAQLSFTPVFDPDVSYESETKYCASPDPIFRSHSSYLDTMEYVYSYDYEELMQQYGYARPVGTGYFTSAPTVVTAEEKEALKKYAEADDMRGFFNYQSRIFKRIIDEIEIDVTATFTDGTEVTKTLELFYTPIDITEREWHNDYWYTDHATYSYSRGTISAKIK